MYTMYTGQGDPYKLATIASVNGQQSLGNVFSSLCNVFSSFFRSGAPLWITLSECLSHIFFNPLILHPSHFTDILNEYENI